MLIAIFGDIHGNIEALRVAYEAAITHRVEKIYHLGDLGGYAPFVNEVVDFLIEHKIEGIQGNYDERSRPSPTTGWRWPPCLLSGPSSMLPRRVRTI